MVVEPYPVWVGTLDRSELYPNQTFYLSKWHILAILYLKIVKSLKFLRSPNTAVSILFFTLPLVYVRSDTEISL